MKKSLIIISLCLLSYSCTEEPLINQVQGQGEIEGYGKWTSHLSRYGDNPNCEPNTINIALYHYCNERYDILHVLLISNLPLEIGTYPLDKGNVECKPYSAFTTLACSTDEGTEAFEIITGTDNWVSIDEINCKEIKGSFQLNMATRSLIKYHVDLPDTLIITNGIFEASLYE